ncbi:MAG: penicillin-binding protein 1C [Treponema sp.]|nr:penicillin-binding protein 1C [Treponema sp.]
MPRIVKIVIIVFACFLLLYGVLRFTPYPALATYQNRSYGFAVLDRNGRLLRVFPAEDGVKREWVPIEDIPAGVVRVFIRAEDSRFYWHPGVDPIAIAAAGLRNLRARRTVSGASTITMQLARLIRPRERGLQGKLLEAFDALRLEARLSKKQILELWINGIPFGSNIEGLPAASRARFGMEPASLDDARAVLLAVIPRRPGLYDPAINPEATATAALALSRRCTLNLDKAALMQAAADAAPDKLVDLKTPFYAPHFTDRTGSGGKTTIDLDLQLYAERRLAAEIALLENNRVTNGAVLAIDNASGAVLVYVGSVSWFDDVNGGKIDGVRVRNQPGSCLKPFLYALALEKGFSPNDILPDIPIIFGSSEAYSPMNFNRRFNGPVRFRVALASSLNIPAVYLLERLGVDAFEGWLADLGFESIAANRGSHGVGLALGNARVSLEELTRAFAVFPRGGQTLDQQVMSPYSAWIISDILADRASRFAGFGPAPTLATEFPSMFKTGTANQFQHIWAVGATTRYTVGVWMGNFSGETVVGRTGSSIPARIAADVLRAIEPRALDFPTAPGNVNRHHICTLSGMAAGPACSGITQEYLLDDIMPAPCAWHRGSVTEYPPEYQAWLAERFRWGRTHPQAAQNSNVRIRLPVSGSVFYFDPTLPPAAQAIRIETTGFSPEALVYANDVLQGSINHAGIFTLPLRRGAHRITVEDENGSAVTDIAVR